MENDLRRSEEDRLEAVQADLLIALALMLLTTALFWPAVEGGFVLEADRQLILDHPHVADGLDTGDLFRALEAGRHGDPGPLTWLSFALDAELVGLDPWGFHLSNVLLHAMNAAMLFLFLRQLTGDRWRPVLAALVWAIHPLRVESVAWVAQRSDLLGTFFALLAGTAWAGYGRTRAAGHGGAWAWYLLTLAGVAAGLLAGPVLVTLPCLLLLLDAWPLRRGSLTGPWEQWKPLLAEKLPMFAAGAVLVVAAGPPLVGAMRAIPASLLEWVGAMPIRLLHTLRFDRLTPFYPEGADPAEVVLGFLVVGLVSAASWYWRRERPALAIGWAWFLVALLPTLGSTITGGPAHADRFSYLPAIGLVIAGAWGVPWAELWRRPRYRGPAIVVLAGVVGYTAFFTARQVRYWRSDPVLLAHAVTVSPQNPRAWNHLGVVLVDAGQLATATRAFARAVELEPDSLHFRSNLALHLAREGRVAEALAAAAVTEAGDPADPDILCRLGIVYAVADEHERAIELYRRALGAGPGHERARLNLAASLRAIGEAGAAERIYRELASGSRLASAASLSLARLLRERGRLGAALDVLQSMVDRHPGQARLRAELGDTLVAAGCLEEAVEAYRQALERDPTDPDYHNNLGSSLARLDRVEEAEVYFRNALALEPDHAAASENLARLSASADRVPSGSGPPGEPDR